MIHALLLTPYTASMHPCRGCRQAKAAGRCSIIPASEIAAIVVALLGVLVAVKRLLERALGRWLPCLLQDVLCWCRPLVRQLLVGWDCSCKLPAGLAVECHIWCIWPVWCLVVRQGKLGKWLCKTHGHGVLLLCVCW